MSIFHKAFRYLSDLGTRYFNVESISKSNKLKRAIVKLRRGSGKDRQGMAPKASKLKPEPRAYTKVGCHLPTHPEVSLDLTNGVMWAR